MTQSRLRQSALCEVALAALLGAALLATGGGARAAVVAGRLGSGRPAAPALRVYAWSRSTGHLYSVAAGTATRWSLDLPPGRYWLFAGLDGPGAPPIYAGYTEYARCQRGSAPVGDCDAHRIVEVEVGLRPLAGIDLVDWALSDDSADAIDTVLGRPPQDPYDASGRAAPKFSEYPAHVQSQPPAAREAVGYRDEDRDAVLAALGRAADFAGRLQLVPVGCGPACSGVAIVDHASGSVHYPAMLNPLPEPAPCDARATLQYRPDSRLLIVRAAGKAPSSPAQLYYYTVDGDGAALTLVSTRLGAELPGTPRCPAGEHGAR